MRAIAAGTSDVGKERVHNEDRFILLPEFNVYVVADGMGGHEAGEVASRMAASSIAAYFRDGAGKRRKAAGPPGAPRAQVALGERLLNAVKDANAKIFARADDSRAYRGMGTTVVAAAFAAREDVLYVAHAGDSRCYLVRDGKIQKLTRDHSLLQDALLERPDLTESDLAYLPKNVITRALGIAPTVEVELRAVPARSGDVFILCSDGLHGLVSDEEIARIVRENEVLTEACGKLIETANTNGGRDNITVVLIRIEDGTAPWATPRGKRRKEESHAKRDADDGALRGRAARVGVRRRGGSG